MYAKIIVDIAHQNVDKLFTYELPFPAQVGQRVCVPFGKADKPTEGFILEITEACPDCGDRKLKSVIKILEDYPAVDSQQIELAHWMCSTYHCTTAQALRLMIPAQLRGMRISEKKLRCVRIEDGANTSAYLDSLRTKNGKLRSQGAYDTVCFLMQASSNVYVKDLCDLVPTCTSSIIKRLVDERILTESYQTVYRRPHTLKINQSPKPTLTAEQQNALNTVLNTMGKSSDTYLIHGVTGSGKTEVYMSIIEAALEQGKGAIVLVPEISLTPQAVERFTGRFGKRVAVLHSKLSAGERFDEWRRIRKGLVDVVVGARSAVFAPIHSLGVIIIDEEHENSYASEKVPRYNTIDVAQKRCKLSGATLILGSATPAVTTYFRAQIGKYKLIEMKHRVNTLPLPEIEIADMRKEFFSGNTGIFSNLLKERLNACINNGEQAILFLNRRGFSSFVSCRACGYVWNCDDCDVAMTYHKFEHKMKCHYCGTEKDVPKLCPKCGKPYIKYSGIGTQQIEEEITSLFPDVKCIRMDADTTKSKDSHIQLLSQFANGDAQIMIGTQMIAKGLDFPNVTLVGVVSVDAMLAMPDFRNTERTFQLLTQVAGRAGRADKKGSVVLQTNDPNHPVVAFAQNHDYVGFYNYAIKNRLENMYPPYSLFVRILFTADDERTAQSDSVSFSKLVYQKMTRFLHDKHADLRDILFIYAMPAPIRRIQNKYRHHVLIKLARTKNSRALVDCVYQAVDIAEIKSQISVEINPSDML